MIPYLSLILPCYNSGTVIQKQLPALIIFLNSQHFAYEIILVDDGSKDDGLLREIAHQHKIRYFRNSHNMGKGAAVRNGMLAASGTFRIFTDSDIPFDYTAISTILKYLDQKEFDIATGDRTLEGSSYFTEIPKARKISSSIFSFFVGRFVTTGLNDTQCGIKGFRNIIAEDIFGVSKVNGFAFDVELLYIALKRNYDIKRIPVTLRNQEESSVSLLKHTIPMIVDLFKIKWNHLKGLYNKKRAL